MAANSNNELSGWTGWIGFASIMLLLAGFFHIMEGIVALFKEDVYIKTSSSAWVLDYSQWGWLHIFGGIIILLAAASLMQGHMFGRIFAVIVALVSAVANMAFIPIYPIWSLVILTVDVLIIWAVIVHGGELRD